MGQVSPFNQEGCPRRAGFARRGGVKEAESDYYPYGVESVIVADTTANHYKFTGKERDSEDGLDYFGARFYSSALGRFLTPDWSATPVLVPYATLGNPQTLNLYSYVENNPITGTDPDGHAQQTVANAPNGYESLQASHMICVDISTCVAVQVYHQDGTPQAEVGSNIDDARVGKTTVGSLEKTMSNEDRSLSTPKGVICSPKSTQN